MAKGLLLLGVTVSNFNVAPAGGNGVLPLLGTTIQERDIIPTVAVAGVR